MPLTLTQELMDRLQQRGITSLLRPGIQVPDHLILEPPCSLKWMSVQHSLELGAFSYAAPDDFPDATVWSHFGQGYGFVPVVLPVLGLLWLRRTR